MPAVPNQYQSDPGVNTISPLNPPETIPNPGTGSFTVAIAFTVNGVTFPVGAQGVLQKDRVFFFNQPLQGVATDHAAFPATTFQAALTANKITADAAATAVITAGATGVGAE